jgi:hypothetical protein
MLKSGVFNSKKTKLITLDHFYKSILNVKKSHLKDSFEIELDACYLLSSNEKISSI